VNYSELDNETKSQMSVSNNLYKKKENSVSCENLDEALARSSPSTLYGTYKSIFFFLF